MTEILGVSFLPIVTATLIMWFMISSICSLLTCHGSYTRGQKIESENWSCRWWRQIVGVTACLLRFGDPNNSSIWTSFYFVWSYWANLCKIIHSRVFSWCYVSKKSSPSPFFHFVRCAVILYGVFFWAEIPARKLPSSSTTLMSENSNINKMICLLRQSICLVWNMTCYFFL